MGTGELMKTFLAGLAAITLLASVISGVVLACFAWPFLLLVAAVPVAVLFIYAIGEVVRNA